MVFRFYLFSQDLLKCKKKNHGVLNVPLLVHFKLYYHQIKFQWKFSVIFLEKWRLNFEIQVIGVQNWPNFGQITDFLLVDFLWNKVWNQLLTKKHYSAWYYWDIRRVNILQDSNFRLNRYYLTRARGVNQSERSNSRCNTRHDLTCHCQMIKF